MTRSPPAFGGWSFGIVFGWIDAVNVSVLLKDVASLVFYISERQRCARLVEGGIFLFQSWICMSNFLFVLRGDVAHLVEH